MIRRLALLAVLIVFTGCAAKTSTEEWKMYARGAYLQGRAEARSEFLCSPALLVRQGGPEQCVEARYNAAAMKEVAPAVDGDLTNNRPDRPRLMRYIELGSRGQ